MMTLYFVGGKKTAAIPDHAGMRPKTTLQAYRTAFPCSAEVIA
jgi:hypothetical protein